VAIPAARPVGDPAKIVALRDWKKFQNATKNLLSSLLSTFHGRSIRFKTGTMPVPTGRGRRRAIPTRVPDWITWKRNTYDLTNSQSDILIDFESTILDLSTNPDYIADKIATLDEIISTNGGNLLEVTRRARVANPEMDDLGTEPIAYLVFISNNTSKFPSIASIESTLRVGSAHFTRFSPRYTCSPSGNDLLCFQATLPTGARVNVGLIGRNKLLELVSLAEALHHASQPDLHDDRFLYEFTSVTGAPRLLSSLPAQIVVQNATVPEPVVIDGRNVTFVKLSAKPVDFMRMASVLRLVNDFGYLQRLPVREHLEKMAQFVDSGGRFPTPLLCVLPYGTILQPAPVVPQVGASPTPGPISSHIRLLGAGAVNPYSMAVVDGQHRAFCFYLANNFSPPPIDINCYILTNDDDRAFISSALFLNVNYRALPPKIELALIHFAYAKSWPSGWISRKKGRGVLNYDSKLNSARVLATRFVHELSRPNRHLDGVFRVDPIQDPTRQPIQSVTTYLSEDFDWPLAGDAANPVARVFGTALITATRDWTLDAPTPEDLTAVWPKLVDEFELYLDLVTHTSAGGNGAKLATLISMIRENPNVFTALWKVFFALRFGAPVSVGHPLRAGLGWPPSSADATRIMGKLETLSTAPGGLKTYQTGKGRKRLIEELATAA
jgi:hypothetical protein